MSDLRVIKSALVSVSDKTHLQALGEALGRRGVTVYSTGGTSRFLAEKAGVQPVSVESVTEFPEMMDGRLKTLHPKVFGGILARRDNPGDITQTKSHGIPLVDLVVVNLYPFSEHLGKSDDEQVEFIDIGGPSLIRAAAKNFADVAVLSDPADYEEFLAHLEAHGGATTRAFRRTLAGRAFSRTAAYDATIAGEWDETSLPGALPLLPRTPLRYGENPHQRAFWAGRSDWEFLQGKELSYNNILDAEAASAIVADLTDAAVAIVKHNNPCGVAAGSESVDEVFAKALACDEKSAFGGIVASNRPIDRKTAERMKPLFLEVVLAPGFDEDALAVFSEKKNLRVIRWQRSSGAFEVRRALGGWLVQTIDRDPGTEARTVTEREVPADRERDLALAWTVVKHVRSNAIVLVRSGATIGIGAGQMSRVDAVEIALAKCGKTSTAGAVLASDAFFPFRDNIDLLAGREIAAIIQPGGSKRDEEVIQACNEHGIAMRFTGTRHFRH